MNKLSIVADMAWRIATCKAVDIEYYSVTKIFL